MEIFRGFLSSGRKCYAIVLLTEWNEYRDIDWEKIAKIMRSPSWVFDARSITKGEEIKNAGLNFWAIGNGSIN